MYRVKNNVWQEGLLSKMFLKTTAYLLLHHQVEGCYPSVSRFHFIHFSIGIPTQMGEIANRFSACFKTSLGM